MNDGREQIIRKFKILDLCYKGRGPFLTICETMKLSPFPPLPGKNAYVIFDLTKNGTGYYGTGTVISPKRIEEFADACFCGCKFFWVRMC